jgi:hypothetical protein
MAVCVLSVLYSKCERQKPEQWREKKKYEQRTRREGIQKKIPTGSEIFHWPNTCGSIMALRSTQYLDGKGGRCVWLTLPPSYADCLRILEGWTSWSPWGLSRPVKGQL